MMYIPMPILLQPLNACTNAAVNINNWIGIDVLVLLVTLAIGAAIYSLSGIIPNPLREKLRGVVRIEYTEGFFSLVLILSLVTIAYAGCNVGFALSGLPAGNYQNVFQSDQYYVNQLLFVTGPRLAGEFIAQGLTLSIDAAFSNYVMYLISRNTESGLLNSLATSLTNALSGSHGTEIPITLNMSGRITNVYQTYASTYTMFSGLIVISFGALFILYFLLPIISALAMTLIIPLAIILRSVSFVGPKLREASNAFIAIGVALFFVFPLAISANQAIVNWLYCQNPNQACNPYTMYLGPYKLSNVPITDLLTTKGVNFGLFNGGQINIPLSFFGTIGASGSGGYGNYITNLVEGLVLLPNQVNKYSVEVAQYLFEGIVLIAIDFAITMGFAQGLYKGLNAIPSVLGGGGPFWGD